MKVVFIAANCSYSHSSLAAWILQAVTLRTGRAWETVEVTVKDDPESVLGRVMQSRPDVVAATLYLFNREFVFALLRRIRELAPACRIVVGGPECLGDCRTLVGPEGIADVAIRGEGELAFPALLERWESGGEAGDIPGVCLSGRCLSAAALLRDLDDIPPFYAQALAGFRKPFIQMETSRGCGNGCLFCTSRKSPVRFHSLERVREDLKAIQGAGVREVRVVDRTFNEDRERALALTTLFRDEFPGLRFHLEVDPARFSASLADEFSRVAPGQFHVEAGIQSLRPAVYQAIGRQATVTRTLEGLRRLCGLGNIEVHVDLIAGLPGGTLADLVDDLRILMALEPAEIQLERLKLLPGTPFAETPGDWGLISSPSVPYQILATPDMTQEDLELADHFSRTIDWFYNVAHFRDLIASGVRADAGFLEDLMRHVREQTTGPLCSDLEARFRVLDGILPPAERSRLHYRWYRLGFSTRSGPCPATSWKQDIPSFAVLIEGDRSAAVARIARVELDVPYLFCTGTGARGERAVVAVYRLDPPVK
ncbi:MAG: radical SAM protein [bacterium]